MRHRGVSQPGIITQINVTPIIDVALVLVIILLVTAPLMSVADLPVDLPEARTREAEDQRNLSITLTADGRLAVDVHAVEASGLRAAVAQRLAEPGSGNLLVVIRADSTVPHAAVRHLLEEARAAGAKRLAVATRQKVEAGS